MQKTDKVTRILMLYQKLLDGAIVKKSTFALEIKLQNGLLNVILMI